MGQELPTILLTAVLAPVRHFGHCCYMRARQRLLPSVATGACAVLVAAALSLPASAERTAPGRAAGPSNAIAGKAGARHIAFTRWTGRSLRHGRFEHTRYDRGVVIGRHPVRTSYDDPYGSSGPLPYSRGRWYSRWVGTPFGLTSLIASYDARTPHGTFLEITARGRTGRRTSSWDSLGRWASHDAKFHRMSLGSQRDDVGHVSVDTLRPDSGVRFTSWQLRVSLYRRTGTAKTPTVTSVGAVAARLPHTSPTSTLRSASERSLPVPQYSQMIHTGEYPRWDGGGEAWCSPTSTSMVLGFWGRLPKPQQYAWVKRSYRQPWVDYAARYTFAWNFDGTGDWPFNTAYAGRFGLDSFVTRLRSLRDAELFVRAGIPLVAAIAFGTGQLDGAPLSSTSGHLLVIRGFTASGNVIVNDPAAHTASTVRRVYKRGQFENAWVDNGGGVVYVIHPPHVRLPNAAAHSNW